MSYKPQRRLPPRMRHDPLGKQMNADPGHLSTKKLQSLNNSELIHPELDNPETDNTLDSRLSKKMFALASEQLQERSAGEPQEKARSVKFNLEALEEEVEAEDYSDEEADYLMNETDMTADDLSALEMFAPTDVEETRTLGDLINERILANERIRNLDDLQDELEKRMPEQFVKVFKDVAKILATWKSGKMPKAFKIIPNLDQWEEFLQITQPEDWSPNTMFQATKMFASNLKPLAAQRFFNLVLLPSVRQNIRTTKRLNFHYYQSVRKAIFKPKAFYRGIIIPLCQSGCTGREAIILCGILGKSQIPRMHTVAALFKLLELPYSGTTHLFIKTMLNKKYSLPKAVLNALVAHFQKFQHDPRRMPVIWHQTFLVFAQRYKKALTKEQKDCLKGVLRVQNHRLITGEIRRELFSNHIEIQKFDLMDL